MGKCRALASLCPLAGFPMSCEEDGEGIGSGKAQHETKSQAPVQELKNRGLAGDATGDREPVAGDGNKRKGHV